MVTTLISSGSYSDYGIEVVVEWQTEKDIGQITEEYLAEHPEQREPYAAEPKELAAWLIARGYVRKVEHRELNLGSYGNLNPEWINRPA